jgi:succinate dehydrogenase / fumarate reductase cytochrome b subunit
MSVAASHSRTSYILDKLQSLSGVIPIGAFLAEHFWSNSYALVSAKSYDNVSSELQLIPWRVFVESLVLFIPLLFHSLYGLYIWWLGKSNVIGHPWMSNWMYTLQRWTGGISFVYIVWHTWTMRFTGIDLHAYPNASFAKVQGEVFQTPFFLFYVVGLIAASWHFAYGIWLFSAKWGIISGEKARKRLLAICLGLFFVLSVAGLASLASFRSRPLQTPEPGTTAMRASPAARSKHKATDGKPVE